MREELKFKRIARPLINFWKNTIANREQIERLERGIMPSDEIHEDIRPILFAELNSILPKIQMTRPSEFIKKGKFETVDKARIVYEKDYKMVKLTKDEFDCYKELKHFLNNHGVFYMVELENSRGNELPAPIWELKQLTHIAKYEGFTIYKTGVEVKCIWTNLVWVRHYHLTPMKLFMHERMI
jgi:hypothetical protein